MKYEVSNPEPETVEATNAQTAKHVKEQSRSDGPAGDGGESDSDGLPENVRHVLDNATAPQPSPAAAPGVDKARSTVAVVLPRPAFGSLGIGRILTIRESDVDVLIGGDIIAAEPHPTLHASVLKTALQTGEPVLLEQNADGSITIMGALRTQPTPGVDEVKNLTIEADRIELRGRKEVLVTAAGVASIALRAAGEIETYADRIVSRAEELHKIVGRMLRLN